MGRSRYRIYDATAPYFLTCTIVQWLPLFAQPANVQILFHSLRFLQTEGRLVLYGYVVMENHCHLLAAGSVLGQAVATSFKSFTAARMLERMAARNSPVLDLLAFHKLRHKRGREHQVWQEGSHPEQVQGGGDDAAEVGVHAPESGRAGVCGRPPALAVFQRPQLRGAGGIGGSGDPLVGPGGVPKARDAGAPARAPTRRVGAGKCGWFLAASYGSAFLVAPNVRRKRPAAGRSP